MDDVTALLRDLKTGCEILAICLAKAGDISGMKKALEMRNQIDEYLERKD